MCHVHGFEKLYVWKVARTLFEEMCRHSGNIEDERFCLLFRTTSTTVLCNIIEGNASESLESSKFFLRSASSSCMEIIDLLYFARDHKYLNSKDIEKLMLCCSEVMVELAILMYKIISIDQKPNN